MSTQVWIDWALASHIRTPVFTKVRWARSSGRRSLSVPTMTASARVSQHTRAIAAA
ncbi:hypothetical protein [Streptomyces sp. NPDC059928]|uniref:hypothetical protein n=1 Tax=unclassified Streptomyces TaxID=2593676 RepID=UPI00365BAB55